jgi:hypothetical protein
MKRRPWTAAENRTMRRLYPNTPTAKLAKMLRRTATTVYQHAATLGVRKSAEYLASPASGRLDGVRGAACRFAKGLVPWNKGTHWTAGGRSKLTRFRKGNYSKRWDREIYCVGALRVNADGGLDIKVKEGLRAWESLARFTWRTERGRIPKGGIIRPINGDPHDTRIENLRLGSRLDLMRENTLHRYPKPVARLIQLRGALMRQINKREGHSA